MGPFGIEQVDVGRALQFYGAGRDMRAGELRAEKERKEADAKAEREGKLADVYRRAMAPTELARSGSVAGAVTSSAASPRQFENPLMRPDVRERLVGEIGSIDPQQVPELFEMFGKLDDAQLDRAKKVYGLGSAIAFELRNAPAEQREAIRQQRIQQLASTIPQFAEILQNAQLDDRSLEALVNQGRDIEKIIDSALPKTMAIPEGGTIYEAPARSPYRQPSAQPSIPQEAIAELIKNPSMAKQFDEVFGQGAAQRVFGTVQNAPRSSATTVSKRDAIKMRKSLGSEANYQAWLRQYGLREE
jgi:hypothetical protein